LRQTILHDRVERLGLALGASRERTFRARTLSQQNEQRRNAPVEGWEDDEVGVLATSSLDIPQRSSRFRLNADLFRDDTMVRAVIMNASLVLIAATILVFVYN